MEAAIGGVNDHLHRIAGAAVDDSEYVQIAGELTPTVFHIAARTVATACFVDLW